MPQNQTLYSINNKQCQYSTKLPVETGPAGALPKIFLIKNNYAKT